MRKFLVVVALMLPATPFLAHGKDMNDRALGLELNRDRSESRIERLHEDKRREDKARAEADKKQPVTPKSRSETGPKEPRGN